MDLTNCKRIVDVYGEFANAVKKLEQYEALLERAQSNPTDVVVHYSIGRRTETCTLPHPCLVAGVSELARSQRAVVRGLQARLESM